MMHCGWSRYIPSNNSGALLLAVVLLLPRLHDASSLTAACLRLGSIFQERRSRPHLKTCATTSAPSRRGCP
ncbi:hypothetical protein IWZ00DRAFT_1156 [Phyllosticta capitalensis]|uniref:uncharacterized protein n=1 Tax=Phyllosticta capitalensis TaxID=121624 RepID=UPI00312F4CCE